MRPALTARPILMPLLPPPLQHGRPWPGSRALSLSLGVILLAGCASPARVAVAPLPDLGAHTQAWQHAPAGTASAPDAAALAQWWRQFNDPTLDALVQQALQHNTTLRVALSTLREAQANRAALEAGARPQAGLNASANRSRSSGRTGTSSTLGLSASWEPDLFGAQSAGQAAAQASEQAATADLATTRMTLSAEVALAYLGWRNAQAQRALTADSLARLEDILQLTDWRQRAGLVSGLDLAQARLSVQQARASLPAQDTSATQFANQLALLTGRTPASAQALLPQATPTAPPQAPGALQQMQVGVPADLLRRRPDVRATEARLRAQWAQREQTRLNGYPGLTLSGSLGLQALSLAALSGGGSGVAALAAAIQWPVFDGGQRTALVAGDDAAVQRTQASFEAAVLGAVKDVEDSLVALQGARAQAESLTLGQTHAQEVLRLTRLQHQAGLVDLRTLLGAERDLLGTQTSLQSAHSAVSQQLVQLFKSLGGGWSEADLPPSATAPSASASAPAPPSAPVASTR